MGLPADREPRLSTAWKGTLAENRIAELVALWGRGQLTCYRPIADDDGIDLIVKRRNSVQSLFIQVKSRFAERSVRLEQTVGESKMLDKHAVVVVFCWFNTDKGDIDDSLWVIPGPELREACKFREGKDGRWWEFSESLIVEKQRLAKYKVAKRELVDRLLQMMDRAT